MTTINNLSTIDSVSSGDQVPVFDESAGTARKMSVSQLLAYFAANFASPEFEVQTAAPTLSGFTLTLTESAKSIWAVLSPTGAFASGKIVLPPKADCFDGQTVIVTSGDAITALLVDGNGATVNGAPSGLGPNGFFQLRYYALTSTWWCVAQSLGSLDSFDDITITGDILSGDGETMLAFVQAGAGTAVNYLTVAYSVAGTGVGLIPAGSDTNIDLEFVQKGAGDIRIGNGSTSDATVTAGDDATLRALTGTAKLEADAGAAVVIGASATISASAGDITLTATGKIEFINAPVLPVSTVAGLPGAPVQGMIAVVTDASATTHNSIVAGGGANVVVVYYDGTNWRIL